MNIQSYQKKCYEEQLTRDLKEERRDNEKFVQIMEDLSEIVPRMWRYGDGQGGSVLYEILKSLQKANMELSKDRLLMIFGQLEIKERKKIKVYTKKSTHPQVRLKVFANDKYQCKHCGTNENLTVDHIIPESKGGSSELDNLQTLCSSCNSKKGVKLP